MSSTETNLAASSRPQRRFHPRAALAALVAAHLVLAALQSLPLPEWVDTRWPSRAGDGLRAASEGLLIGQMAVLATYVALGSGRWSMRFVRGVMLLLWFVLALLAGSLMLDGGRDRQVFEEFLAQYTWTVGVLFAPLLIYRFVARRRLTLVDLTSSFRRPNQFQLSQLLLFVTELAVLMGLVRMVVAWNSFWMHELSRSMREFPQYALHEMSLLGILTAVPAALISLHVRRTLISAVLNTLWPILLVTASLAYLLASRYWFAGREHVGSFPFMSTYVYWALLAHYCLAIALVIWSSFSIVRAIGYDFLPLPRRGGSGEGGRQSSAATSAA